MMYKSTTCTMYTLVFILAILGVITAIPPHGRIYGGEAAAPGQFPFIVSFHRPEQFCDGSIINKNWIVTAAHCVDVLDSSMTVRVGTNLANSGGKEYNIVKWTRHENFNDFDLQDDIGVVQIDGEFEFDDLVQPVEFVDPEPNTACHVAGWGVTDVVEFPEELQFVEQTALNADDCQEYIGIFGSDLGRGQICGYAGEGKGACSGDSGGPFVCDGKLAGIASYVISGCAEGYPDVYTKPSAYVDWINDNINP